MRWRLRFGTRTLLVVVTIFCVWLGLHVRRTQSQRDGVAAIREYGGWVRYDFQFPDDNFRASGFVGKAESPVPEFLLNLLGVDFFHNVVQVNLNYSEDSGKRLENKNRTDEALQHLHCFPKLRVLLLQETQVTDASMKYIGEMTELESIYMWDAAEVSDDGVRHLANLKKLHQIHLSTSRITDDSLAVFAKLPLLEDLSLQFNHFTDRGITYVVGLPRLNNLWLCGDRNRKNEITDQGLIKLQSLTKLRELGVQNTFVSPEGLEAFQKANPNCKIYK